MQNLKLAAGFDAVKEADWLSLVEKTLQGRPLDSLIRRTDDGFDIKPLYTDLLATTVPGMREGVWDIRQAHDHPDPRDVNRLILDDLERGATSIILHIDPEGRNGMVVRSLADLEEALDQVFLTMVPLVLQADGYGAMAAGLLTRLWDKRGHAPEEVSGNLGLDPLTAAAMGRATSSSLDDALGQAAALAGTMAARHPNMRSFRITTDAWHSAGATPAQELAVALSAYVAYLRAMESNNVPLEAAAQQIDVCLAIDSQQFLNISKYRAFRQLMAMLEKSLEVKPAYGLEGRTAARVFAKGDPWVNLLRATGACFAAGIGGADAITLDGFDHRFGPSDRFARRLARNIQVMLQEESGLARVTDPAAGSYALDAITKDLAAAAWRDFQSIEASGGLGAWITLGQATEAMAQSWQVHQTRQATRKQAITGVSIYPNPAEKPLERPEIDRQALIDRALSRADGPTLEPVDVPEGSHALRLHHDGEAFEELRRRAAARPAAARVTLVKLGPLARHGARANWIENLMEAGGLRCSGIVIENKDDAANATPETDVAILCGADEDYEHLAFAVAEVLKTRSIGQIWMAGKPGAKQAALQALGVGDFIYAGQDVVAVLRSIHDHLGLEVTL